MSKSVEQYYKVGTENVQMRRTLLQSRDRECSKA